MSTLPPPPGLTADDYEQIESAVMETARGRWFLMEFARRVRANESQQLLDAIERLGSVVESNFSRVQNQLGPSLPAPHEAGSSAGAVPDMLALAPQPLLEPRPHPQSAPESVMPPVVSTASPLMARLEANLRQPVPPAPRPVSVPNPPQEIDVRAVFAPLDVMGGRERLAFFA